MSTIAGTRRVGGQRASAFGQGCWRDDAVQATVGWLQNACLAPWATKAGRAAAGTIASIKHTTIHTVDQANAHASAHGAIVAANGLAAARGFIPQVCCGGALGAVQRRTHAHARIPCPAITTNKACRAVPRRPPRLAAHNRGRRVQVLALLVSRRVLSLGLDGGMENKCQCDDTNQQREDRGDRNDAYGRCAGCHTRRCWFSGLRRLRCGHHG